MATALCQEVESFWKSNKMRWSGNCWVFNFFTFVATQVRKLKKKKSFQFLSDLFVAKQ